MSAVVDIVSDVVGGAVEAVGDVFEGAVEIVEDVGSAIDDYVIQPILDDPLTAIATAAGAYYLGPMMAPTLGVPATGAVAAGAGAAAGNFASNVAQGEDFDQALKEAALTGVTVGATTAASNALFGPEAVGGFEGDIAPEVGVDIDAFGNPIDAGAGTNPYVSGYQAPAPVPDLSGTSPSFLPSDSLYEMGLDNFAPGETLPGFDVTPQAPILDTGVTPDFLPADSLYEMGLDDFAPGETLPGVDVGPQAPTSYFDQAMAELEALDPRMQEPGFNVPEFAPDAPLPTDLTGATDYSRMLEPIRPLDLGSLGPPQGMGVVGAPAGGFMDRLPSMSDLGSLDYWGDLAGKAIDYTMDNPLTVAGGALLLDAAMSPPDIPQPPVRRPNETDEQFNRRLQLYEYQRERRAYEGDLTGYGYGAQHQFYTPSQFIPIEPPPTEAAAGGLMQSQPSYYRYGQQPMARGGRMITSPLAQYGQGGAHGRSDDVPAVLSDGEYVIDAETVALLGNGSVDAGANQLDRMREEIRRHKGKSLAKGQISDDARSPLSYLKG